MPNIIMHKLKQTTNVMLNILLMLYTVYQILYLKKIINKNVLPLKVFFVLLFFVSYLR